MAIVFSLGMWPEGAGDTVAADLSRKLDLKMSQKDKENDADKHIIWFSSSLVVLSLRQKTMLLNYPFKSGYNYKIHLMTVSSQ